MKLIVPNYYPKFKCIADQCAHNCCIGWEIDINAEALEFYRSIPGSFGKRLKENIAMEDEPHFRLDSSDRCPFLNQCNLCDIISTLGEDALCSICADHPRFRNEFGARTEMGLGLCCEAAAALILGQQEKTELILLQEEDETLSEEEAALLALRVRSMEILQNQEFPLHARLEQLCDLCGCNLPDQPLPFWREIYRSLERLDPAWDRYLDRLAIPTKSRWERPLEKAAVYFLYRHLPGALADGLLQQRIRFIALSVLILQALGTTAETFEDFIEMARMYSAEIEYSDQNVEALLNYL